MGASRAPRVLLGERVEGTRPAAVVVGRQPARELVAEFRQRNDVAERVGRLADREHHGSPQPVVHALAAVADRRPLDDQQDQRRDGDRDDRVARAEAPRLARGLRRLGCPYVRHVRRRSR
jgi:hypothetical protein